MLVQIVCDDTFEQPEASRRVLRKLGDGKAETVVFVHVEKILADTQATMERFAADLGEKFKVKSMVEKFGVEKAKRTPASPGVLSLSSSR